MNISIDISGTPVAGTTPVIPDGILDGNGS